MKRVLLIISILCCIKNVHGQGSVSGSSNVCLGSAAQYSVSGSSATSGYIWTVPSGSSITSGQGSNTITINFSTAGSGNYVYVTGNGLNANTSITVLPYTPTPGAISGPSVLCPGGSATFSSSISTPYTSVIWYVTNGSATVTNQTGSAIVSIPSNASLSSFQVNVFEVNGMCGPGPTVSTPVTISNQLPSVPTISGSPQVCLSAQSVVYSAATTNASGYAWSVPAGATIASGQNTNSITVNYSSSAVSGNVSVYGTNCNGNGSSASLAITSKPVPIAATAITGTGLVCPGVQGITYSVPAIAGATGYVWSVPAGATIASGQNTNNITVNYPSPAVNGNVGVYGTNCTGNGTPSLFAVTIKPGSGVAETIVGKTQVCPGEIGIPYSVAAIANATGYVWTVPNGATITSGQNTNSIVVDFSASASYGSITVAGINCGIAGAPSMLQIPLSSSVSADNVDYAVDMATGTLTASLPLFTVQSGDVQVPGVLSYAGTGVQVTDDDGWTGHHWNLSIESYGVFRSMRNLPDDYTGGSGDLRKGWLFGTAKGLIDGFNPQAGNDNMASTCADEGNNYAFLSGLGYDQDTEPDGFHVNAPGLSVDFYFDKDRVPRLTSLQNVIIKTYIGTDLVTTSSTSTGPITAFTITNEQGVIYIFNEVETMTENMYQVDSYYFVRQTNQHVQQITYTTSWRLTKITSPVYGSIDLTYTSVVMDNSYIAPDAFVNSQGYYMMALPSGYARYNKVVWDLTYNYRYPLVTSNAYGAGSTLSYRRTFTSKILANISSSTSAAVFLSVPKRAGSTMQRLHTIFIYDKRDGSSHQVRKINFSYMGEDWQSFQQNGNNTSDTDRVFLAAIEITAGCSAAHYNFGYNNAPKLPAYDSPDKDQWGLYKSNSYSYQETSASGSLCNITQPLGGYSAFFYSPHDFVDGSGKVIGGGIRVRKIITYDGTSSDHDQIQEFYYTQGDGITSSGKLQHRPILSFPVVKQVQLTGYGINVPYRSVNGNANAVAMFTLSGNQDMSAPVTLNGSMVAYQRVTVKTSGQGQSVYEYDLSASADDVTANNNEWNASTVMIARPASSPCFETANIAAGEYRYPFPVNPNYDFARGLLTKVTNYNEAGIKVRDVINNYSRIYGVGNTGIRKIYGLTLEELPTYSYNNATYTNGKMFLFSKYEIFTEVKTELTAQIETIYNSSNLAQNQTITTSYFYDSPNHREMARAETQNSDGVVSRNRLYYNKDFAITTATGTAAAALVNLKTANRTVLVESLSSKIISGTEKYTGADLTLFQTVNGVVYPDKHYSFASVNGSVSFSPSTISGGTTFQYDQNNYVLDNSFLSFDSYGNATSTVGRSRQVSSVSYGYNGTLPVIQVSGAAAGEIGYSDFETTAPVNFSTSGFAPSYSAGRTGNASKALNLPAGSVTTSALVLPTLAYSKSPTYTLSAWIKSPANGTISIRVFNISGNTNTTFPCSYVASTDYRYYRFTIPVGSAIGTNTQFYIMGWSSVSIQIDDIAFYPSQADIVTSTYVIPNGKTSDTDSRGASYFYDNDSWGRPMVVYDRDRNVVKKYSYQSR